MILDFKSILASTLIAFIIIFLKLVNTCFYYFISILIKDLKFF